PSATSPKTRPTDLYTSFFSCGSSALGIRLIIINRPTTIPTVTSIPVKRDCTGARPLITRPSTSLAYTGLSKANALANVVPAIYKFCNFFFMLILLNLLHDLNFYFLKSLAFVVLTVLFLVSSSPFSVSLIFQWIPYCQNMVYVYVIYYS